MPFFDWEKNPGSALAASNRQLLGADFERRERQRFDPCRWHIGRMPSHTDQSRSDSNERWTCRTSQPVEQHLWAAAGERDQSIGRMCQGAGEYEHADRSGRSPVDLVAAEEWLCPGASERRLGFVSVHRECSEFRRACAELRRRNGTGHRTAEKHKHICSVGSMQCDCNDCKG